MDPKKAAKKYNDLNEDELIIELNKAELDQLNTAVELAKANALGDDNVKIAKIALAARLDNDAQKEIDKIKQVIDTKFIQPDLTEIIDSATKAIKANADKPSDYADKAVGAIKIATGESVTLATDSIATGESVTLAKGLTPSISVIYQPHAEYIVNLLLHQLSANIRITNTVTDSSSNNVTRTLLINAVDASNNTTTEFIPKDATINIPP